MDKDKIVVAIELGSSKISGAAARKNADGRLEVIACASVPSSSFIRQGTVYNLDRTAEGIARLIELLERQIGTTVTQVFTGYAGKSLRSWPVTISRELEEGAVVTSSVVDDMLVECGDTQTDDMLSLSIASQEFFADHKNNAETDPIGVACNCIEGHFQKIMIRPRLFKLLDDSFRYASVDIADSFVQPLAVANIILDNDDRQRGCALVDYGADTTTVTIYKGGQMCYMRVIPLGSDTITQDIMKVFRLSHDEADSLKCTYGLFGLSGSGEETTVSGGSQVSLKLLGEVIEARNEEIMANVMHQLKASGYYDSLFNGIVLTGGGANLKKLQFAMEQMFPDVNPIRVARNTALDVKWCDTDWNISDGTHIGLLSLLLQGEENCCLEIPVKDMYKEPDAQTQATMVPGVLFDANGESAQAVRDQIEQERIEAAEKEKDVKKEVAKSKTPSFISGIRETFHKFFEDVQ